MFDNGQNKENQSNSPKLPVRSMQGVSKDNFHTTRFARLKPMEMGEGVEGWMNLKGGKARILTTFSISKLPQ